MDAYSHRLAISRRFGTRIAAGDAFFLRNEGRHAELPYTERDGVPHHFSGANRFMLMQVMQDRSWSDPRFFTADQIRRNGWRLAQGAAMIRLQFLIAAGDDGLPLEEPQTQQFHVFNAGDIVGVSERIELARNLVADIDAAAEKAGFRTRHDGPRSVALFDWLNSMLEADELGSALRNLRVAMAQFLVISQTEDHLGGVPVTVNQAAEWAREIDSDPISFFYAIADAEGIATKVLSQINDVAIEREAFAATSRTRAAAAVKISNGKLEMNMGRTPGTTARVEAMFAERSAVLAVPWEDKDKVKAMGAVWYPPQTLWFVPKGIDVAAFRDWNPRENSMSNVATAQTLHDEFRKVMEDVGLDTSKPLLDDGQWHNVPVNTKQNKSNLSGSYIFSLDGARDGGAIGTVRNHYSGETFTWHNDGPMLTPEQRTKMRAEVMFREQMAARKVLAAQEIAAIHANEIWNAAGSPHSHGYVEKKGISGTGMRQISGEFLLDFDEFKSEGGGSVIRAREQYLLVPMSNAAGEIRALQAISKDGAVKCFMRGAEKKGTMFVLGAESFDALTRSNAAMIAYVEGAATGDSFHRISGLPVVICFDAGNLEVVANATFAKLSASVTKVLAVDDDQYFVERAIGYLVAHMGLNPYAIGGETVSVARGNDAHRSVSLGEAVVDCEFHMTPKGRYSITPVLDDATGLTRSLNVEIVPNGGRKVRHKFENRGIEAGLAVMDASSIMVIPDFSGLEGRPTDWNDLEAREGAEAMLSVLRNALGRSYFSEIKHTEVVDGRRAAGVSR